MNALSPTRVLAVLLPALMVSPPALAAGPLIPSGQESSLTIAHQRVDVQINDALAITTVTQVFRNTENRQVEALYTFPVPKGASVANFSMWIGGKEMIGEVVEKEQAFEEWIKNLEKRMGHHVKYLMQEQKNNVLSLIHHQAFQNFKLRILNLSQRVDELEVAAGRSIQDIRQWILEGKSRTVLYEEKMAGLIRGAIQNSKGLWEKLSVELDSLSPLNILKKGYSLCWKDGSQDLIRKVDEVSTEEKITVSFLKGELSCIVQMVNPNKKIESRFKEEYGDE